MRTSTVVSLVATVVVYVSVLYLACGQGNYQYSQYSYCVCQGGCNAPTDDGYGFLYQCRLMNDPDGCTTAADCNSTCYKACAVCYGGNANARCETGTGDLACQCRTKQYDCVTDQPSPMTSNNNSCLNLQPHAISDVRAAREAE